MSSSMRVALLAMLPIILVDTQSMAAPIQCLPGQAAALLQLKRSFDATVGDYFAAFRSWVAGADCCHWDGVRCGGNDGRAITFLDLRGHQLQAEVLDAALFSLTSLEYLDISSNDFSASKLPATGFELLAELTHLDLSDDNFAGEVPAGIGHLTNLVYLDLSTSFIDEELDEENSVLYYTSYSLSQLSEPSLDTLLANLTNLQELRLGMVDMSSNGARCGLQLSNNNFEGWFPPIIFQHKKLRGIDLSKNFGISGNLPNFSADSNLQSISVSNTNFSGTIPNSISNLKSLKELALGASGFSGVLPSSIGKLKSLDLLEVSGLQLVGSIPSWISNLTSLNVLNFFHCDLSGRLPASIVYLTKLTKLALYNCHFSGEIRGAIPQWVWKTSGYFSLLNLSHNKFTSTGSDPLLPLNIEFFDLSFNKIEGVIPIPQKGSITLDYSNNQFSSMPLNFSTYLKKTIIFKASKNNLSGNIPPLICDGIKSLQPIDLSNNYLTGIIPSCLMEDASALQVLSLKENNLTGELPDNIKEGCALSALDFSGNLIQGKLPRSLVACRNLEILDIGNNQISDSFPCWMSKLPQLQVLVLKSNRFIGQMDISYTGDANNCQFTKLRIADIASNNFSGMLPEEWFKMLKSMMTSSDNGTSVMESRYYHGQTYQFTAALTYKGNDITISKILTSLVLIDVSNNDFHGSIPSSIGELALLHGLNMSRNMLTGPIPTQFGNLNNLESLDLSSNKLSNEIPEKLASLNFLATLNLSYNMLAGRIPQSSHFSTFSNASFEGNIGLCGAPLSKQCSYRSEPNIMPHASKKDPIDVLLFLFTGLGFGVCFGITILVIWGSNKRNQQA
uniref:non-specific serine/threonine protein kinase n=1 Tax=Oryza meridionalis TaxID=40149 RepID=A0A0E0CKB0_9ORYZ